MTKIKKTVMIALGGNALSPKTEVGTIEQQFDHTHESLAAVMHFVKANYNICITHGNGPQVGAELLRNEIAGKTIPPLPLGVLVANTQGAMGYMIQQSLQNALYKENANREVVTFVSQMKIDGNVSVNGDLLIYGTIHGDVKSDGEIISAKNSTVNGNIESKNASISMG